MSDNGLQLTVKLKVGDEVHPEGTTKRIERLQSRNDELEKTTNIEVELRIALDIACRTLEFTQARNELLEGVVGHIKCPDNAGGLHRWGGDGQCLDCCCYATDLNDQALAAVKEGKT